MFFRFGISLLLLLLRAAVGAPPLTGGCNDCSITVFMRSLTKMVRWMGCCCWPGAAAEAALLVAVAMVAAWDLAAFRAVVPRRSCCSAVSSALTVAALSYPSSTLLLLLLPPSSALRLAVASLPAAAEPLDDLRPEKKRKN
jgi:hypothetical protein